MPEIDLLIISHDHYDHLDYATIKALMPKVKRVVTPLGVGSHLRYWGMDAAIIDEVDWNQTIKSAMNSPHMRCRLAISSGRGLKRNQTLWASFLFVTRRKRFITAAIAAMACILRPLANSLALSIWHSMENGQYDQDWNIHMMPEETAQAADDLRARSVLPGHAGRFVLAKHSWDDPYQRLAAAAKRRVAFSHANAGRTGVGR